MNLFDVMTGKISRMSHVNRYSSFPVNRRENVAEHSWWVTFIAYVIASDLYKKGEDINFEMLLEKAMMHDVSEVMSGDVIRSYKHTNRSILSAMHEADELNTQTLFDGEEYHPIGTKLFRDWQFAKLGDMIEGQIVAFADMAAVAFYCREEDRSGNRAIRAVLKEAYESWFSGYHKHPLLGQYIDQMFPEGRWFNMMREEALPARAMFGYDGIDGGPHKAMMRNHSEGETAAYDSAAWPEREVPLG